MANRLERFFIPLKFVDYVSQKDAPAAQHFIGWVQHPAAHQGHALPGLHGMAGVVHKAGPGTRQHAGRAFRTKSEIQMVCHPFRGDSRQQVKDLFDTLVLGSLDPYLQFGRRAAVGLFV
jgi:hypothetical protein